MTLNITSHFRRKIMNHIEHIKLNDRVMHAMSKLSIHTHTHTIISASIKPGGRNAGR